VIGWLLVSLQAFAVAAVAAALTSLVASVLLVSIPSDRTAARRADASFLLGLLPGLVAIGSWVAVVMPSFLHATGLRLDHCGEHTHHAHLCAIHAGAPVLPLVALGVLVLGITVWRGARLARRQWLSVRLIGALERLGTELTDQAHPVVLVPGSPRLCVATGLRRRRVLLSSAITQALAPSLVDAALAHEHAHLRRHDPLLRVVLAWAGLFSPPSSAALAQRAFAEAAEEACDAVAASSVDRFVLAESLVRMARITHRRVPATALAFCGATLERRVSLLLEGPARPSPSRVAPLATLSILLCTAAAIAGADALHHAVESLLHSLG
jgi:beta-lactamase regulating signal transducer with metallopeptidase domain